MGKGKREASRFGSAEYKKQETGTARQPSAGVGDPFAGDGNENSPGFLKKFWDSGKGKILLVAAACIAILGTAAGIAVSMWVKAPALPNSGVTGQQPSSTDKISTTPDQRIDAAVSADDELYPDDGYGGDMPTVSGNRKEGMYTFLLVGTDMDDGNTDTIMVVSYDTVNQNLSIMSIPRDTMINESWDIKKINSVYSRYSDGIGALKKRLKTLIGFTPDYYAKVDLSMFVKLVDLIGGVEFDVPQDMNYEDPYQNLYIHLKKGVQVLDGEKAMELVRFRRYSEGDIKRVEVQQNFIKALIKECLSIKHWGKIKAYIDLAMENVETDLEFGSVVWFTANVLGLNSGVSALNMDDVYTCTLPGDYWGSAWSRTTSQEQSYVTIYPKQVVELVNERFNPYEQRVTTSMLDAMSILSNGNIASSTGSVRDTTHNSVMASRRGEGSSGKTDSNKTDSNKSDSSKPESTEPNRSDSGIQINPNGGTTANPNSDGSRPGNQTGQTAPLDPLNPLDPDTPDGENNGADVPDSQTGNNDTGNDPGGISTEPELPTESNVPSEPAPVPEPVPVPEPDPEPVIDTDIPEWLLS